MKKHKKGVGRSIRRHAGKVAGGARKAENIQREFSKFAEGIEELETLRRELKALDTRGFDDDARIIRAKLHDVDNISQVKREIEGLRKRIERAHATKIRKKAVSRSGILKESDKIKRKIANLEEKIEKRREHGRSPISREDVGNIKDIPKLETALRRLKNEFEEHNQAKMKIDSGVGLIVSTKFSDFLSAVKGELSERVRQKEFAIDKGLKADLQEREKMFAERYGDLVDEFHKRYEQKIHEELKREVGRRFNEVLDKKLRNEEKKLVSLLVRDNISKLKLKKAELESMKEGELRKRVSDIKLKMHEEVRRRVDEGLKAKEKQIKSELESDFEEKFRKEVGKKKAELEERKKELEEHVSKEAARLRGNAAEEKAMLEKKKAELEERVVRQAKRLFK